MERLGRGEFAAPAWADLDADGEADLALGIRDGGITLWHNGAEDAIRGCSPLVDDVAEPLAHRPEAPRWQPAPNPVAAGGWLAVPGASLLVLDLAGRTVAHLRTTGGRVLLPETLSAGTYLIQPLSGNTTGAPRLGSARRVVVEADR